MKDIAITFSSDSNYINYANALIGTLKEHNTYGDIIYRCVDFTDTDTQQIKHPDIMLLHDKAALSNNKSILKDDTASVFFHYGVGRENLKDLVKLLYSPRSVYTCHSRFKTINELLDKGYKKILCLDVDTIINGEINHMFNLVEGYDMMTIITKVQPGDVIEYHGNSKYTNNSNTCMDCMFNEGMILINNTQASRALWRDVSDYIFSDDNWMQWNADSMILNKLLNDNHTGVSIRECSDVYKNSICCDDALMWSGESVTKTNPKFIQKVEQYN